MHTYAHPIPFIKKTKHLILLYFLMTGEMQKRKAEIYAQFFFGAPFGLSLLSFLVPEVSHHCFVLKLQRIGATACIWEGGHPSLYILHRFTTSTAAQG